MVQLDLLLVGKGEVTVESGSHRPGPGVGPAFPEVDPEEEPNNEFPHRRAVSLTPVSVFCFFGSFVQCDLNRLCRGKVRRMTAAFIVERHV